jgi:hypothetical protein
MDSIGPLSSWGYTSWRSCGELILVWHCHESIVIVVSGRGAAALAAHSRDKALSLFDALFLLKHGSFTLHSEDHTKDTSVIPDMRDMREALDWAIAGKYIFSDPKEIRAVSSVQTPQRDAGSHQQQVPDAPCKPPHKATCDQDRTSIPLGDSLEDESTLTRTRTCPF